MEAISSGDRESPQPPLRQLSILREPKIFTTASTIITPSFLGKLPPMSQELSQGDSLMGARFYASATPNAIDIHVRSLLFILADNGAGGAHQHRFARFPFYTFLCINYCPFHQGYIITPASSPRPGSLLLPSREGLYKGFNWCRPVGKNGGKKIAEVSP
ncbi:MAG: hypothetical protein PWQ91_255 [Eubacteriales bacterium]|nr:hypothetical protein [Eubacteriales bacterium]MDN5363194.1 hypothetical protein [Eubacteriales bacterium]